MPFIFKSLIKYKLKIIIYKENIKKIKYLNLEFASMCLFFIRTDENRFITSKINSQSFF